MAGLALALAATAFPIPAAMTLDAGAPAVVVDYGVRTDAYRVVGDASLLSQRYTPGSTFKLIIAAVALESGDLTEATAIPCRANGSTPSSKTLLTPSQALRDSNDDFFSQVVKRTGYEPIRQFLLETRYASAVPDAVGSFADLARGEPIRVSVFEQNLFLQAFLRRTLPLRPGTYRILEKWLVVEAGKPAWGKAGTGEFAAEPPRYVSWFNGVAWLSDGPHVITVAALASQPDPVAPERFRRYLSGRRQ